MLSWYPTPQDVADHLPTRFGDDGPDAYTSPTLEQLERLIERRAVQIRNECGRVEQVDDPDILELAEETLALGVASYVAAQFFPEQQDNSEEQQFLRRRYEEHRRLLKRQIRLAWYAERDD